MTIPTTEARNIKSPFLEIIGISYYDGYLDGFLIDKIDNTYFFHLIDWYNGGSLRAFEILELSISNPENLLKAFTDIQKHSGKRSSSWPFLLVKDSLGLEEKRIINMIKTKTHPIAIVVTEDITKNIKFWHPVKEKINCPGPLDDSLYYDGFDGSILKRFGFLKEESIKNKDNH